MKKQSFSESHIPYYPCSVIINSFPVTLQDRNEVSSEIAGAFVSHILMLIFYNQTVQSAALDILHKGTLEIQIKE